MKKPYLIGLLLILLTVLVLPLQTVNASVLFSNGFESGNFTGWTAQGGTPTVVNTKPHNGTYSMFANAAEYTYVVITASNINYMRSYIYFDTLPGTGGKSLAVVGCVNSGGIYYALGGVNDNVWTLQTAEGGSPTYTSSGVTVIVDQWYCVEVLRDITNDHAELWVNGVSVAERDYTSINQNYIYATGSSQNIGTPTVDLYVDDVVVADAYIGPFQWTKTASKAFTFTESAARTWEASRAVSKALVLAFSDSRLVEYGRTATRALTTGFSVSELSAFSRTVSGSVISVFGGSRTWEGGRAVSQVFSLGFNVARVAEFSRAINQGFTFVFGSSAEKLSGYLREVSMTITGGFSNSRLAEYGRTISEAITFAFSSLGSKTGGEMLRDVGLAIGFAGSLAVTPPFITIELGAIALIIALSAIGLVFLFARSRSDV